MKSKGISSKKGAGKQPVGRQPDGGKPGGRQPQTKASDKVRIDISGLKLRKIREKSGRSQAQVAEVIRSSQGYISKLEHLNNANLCQLNLSSLNRYVKALGGKLVLSADFPADKLDASQIAEASPNKTPGIEASPGETPAIEASSNV